MKPKIDWSDPTVSWILQDTELAKRYNVNVRTIARQRRKYDSPTKTAIARKTARAMQTYNAVKNVPISRLTDTEGAKLAGVSRQTFYEHAAWLNRDGDFLITRAMAKPCDVLDFNLTDAVLSQIWYEIAGIYRSQSAPRYARMTFRMPWPPLPVDHPAVAELIDNQKRVARWWATRTNARKGTNPHPRMSRDESVRFFGHL
jgi:hypothetical protein